MADDFDDGAAQPVGEVIAELRASLGLPADGSTPAAADDKKTAADEGDGKGAPAAASDKTADDKPEGQEAEDEKGELSDKDKAPARSAGLTKILEKYGFDEEKFADGWYNLQNSTALVVKRLEALEERIAEQAGSKEPDPDVVRLNEELEGLVDDIKENRQHQRELVSKGEKTRDSIAKLMGRMEATEDANTKDSLQTRIDALKDQLEAQADKWKDIDRDNKRLDRKAQAIDARRKDLEKEVEDRRKESRGQEQSVKAWQQDQGYRFNTALKALGQIYDMTPNQHSAVSRLIKDDIAQFLRKNPEGDPIDLVKFVGVRAKVHTADFNIKTKFAKAGADKKDVAGGNGKRTTTTETTAVRPKTDPRASQEKAAEDAAAARAHARKIMGTA